jgi:urease accessory protein
MSHSHEHGGQSHTHSHEDGGHGHTHEIWGNAGSYVNRERPIELGRDWHERAFTVGIGGYVTRIAWALLMLGPLVLVVF